MRTVLVFLLAAATAHAAPKKRTTSPSARPNVLFIVADDLRLLPQAKTPNMDRLAKMGMRLTNAHCNYALCNASRTSLLTGMLPSSSGIFGNEQDWRRSIQTAGKPTLPEHFKAGGYLTAAAGKIFHANHGGPEGRLAGWHGGRRGFELDSAWDLRFPRAGVQIPDLPVHTGQNFNHLNIWHWDWGAIPVEDDQTDDGQCVRFAADFLAKKQRKPFFFALGLYRPHSPWYVPQKYFDLFPLENVTLPEVKENDLDDVPEAAKSHINDTSMHQTILKAGKWKEAVQAYLANVAFCDAMLGRVLDAVLNGPNAKNTLIILTSDHGWYLGEKQSWHKGGLWEEATHVPLYIVAPGVTRPETSSNQPAALIDLYPTLCDLAGLPAPGHLDGTSLKPLLTDPTTICEKPAITASGSDLKPAYAARDARWRYIRHADGSEELYNHDVDPHEWTNLAAAPEHAAVKARLATHFPARFHAAQRPAADVVPAPSPAGSVDLTLHVGDALSAAESPKIEGRGIYLNVAFDYNPEIDGESTLAAHGDAKLGYVLHLVASRPTLTLFVEGKATSIAADTLEAGPANVRALIASTGFMSIAVPGKSEVLDLTPFPSGFPSEPAAGLTAGRSFGPLSVNDFPSSTPFDGKIRRLNLTIMPKTELITRPSTGRP